MRAIQPPGSVPCGNRGLVGRCLLVVLVTLTSWSCANDDTLIGPDGTRVANVAGGWDHRIVPTAVTGEECVVNLFRTVVGGTASGWITMTQSGATLSANMFEQLSGKSCTLSGVASRRSFVLHWTACDADEYRELTCGPGMRRDMRLDTFEIEAQLVDGGAVGTANETWSVYDVGSTVRIGDFAITSTFTASGPTDLRR
jgi:hypothetical protein